MATVELDASSIRMLLGQCAVSVTQGCSCGAGQPAHMTKPQLLEKLKWAYSLAEQLPDIKGEEA